MSRNTFPYFFHAHALIITQYSQSSLSICGGGELLYAAATEYSLQHTFINDFLLQPHFRAKAWCFPHCRDKQTRMKEMKIQSIHLSGEDSLRHLCWGSLHQNADLCRADLK